ncbi:MAG: MBL fold metallo-hydrolase [Candidatus Aminicenantes bacterium]|nr:MAG: MBL fold metallo-hydrolase [Candidatus Aminicenantes bacterium]
MIELLFIGTGGSVATEERDNTSFLLLSQDTAALIDCPGSVIQKLKKAQIDPRSVHSIIVTHIHPDHIYGLPSLIHSLMLEDCVIEILGSERSVNFCAELLDLFNLRSEKVKCHVNFIPVVPGEDYRISPSLTCAFYKIPHSPSSMAVGFHKIEEGLDLLYSGDTPRFPELLQRVQNIDYLIHDCSAPSRIFEEYPSLYAMHTDSLALGKIAQEAGVKHLVPCHFFGEVDFSIKEIEDEIRENFRGELTIPEDFSRIPLTKKT